jgi:hypothetical protein
MSEIESAGNTDELDEHNSRPLGRQASDLGKTCSEALIFKQTSFWHPFLHSKHHNGVDKEIALL